MKRLKELFYSLLIQFNQKLSSHWQLAYQQREALLRREHIILNSPNESFDTHFKTNTSTPPANEDSFEDKVINLFKQVDITSLAETQVTTHIESFVNKGIELKQEIQQALSQNLTAYLEKNVRPCSFQHELCAFIKQTDELSLRVKQIQIHINQLMSCYEIH